MLLMVQNFSPTVRPATTFRDSTRTVQLTARLHGLLSFRRITGTSMSLCDRWLLLWMAAASSEGCLTRRMRGYAQTLLDLRRTGVWTRDSRIILIPRHSHTQFVLFPMANSF